MQERIKELEGTVQQLRKEQKADREMLRDVCAHRDRLQQLRKSEERLRQRGSPSAPSALSTQRSIASSSKESSTTCNPTDSPPEAK
ncbi:unnamed protein product [Effrenium voratum]|uniref:Uncharacterized protein n=1 Tax=Effrenium voratum TaxID=2562239 RepID=A0AA36ISB6_9DINO|nr:unnamed protein product [Effrenium voratum]